MRKIIFLLLIISVAVSKAQYIKPFFNTLSIENGLPEGFVVASLQDNLGYMWFGTQNGLVRYNGYELKPYSIPDDRGNPLIYCSIQQLHEDGNGQLWALVDKEGLYCLDRQKDAFFKLKIDTADRNLFKDYFFYKWVEDQKTDTHWFLAVDFKNNFKPGLFSFDARQFKFQKYDSAGKGTLFIPTYENMDLLQDANGKLWFAADSLIGYFDEGSRSFKSWFVLPDSTRKLKISGLSADPLNNDLIWVTTYISGVNENKNPYKRSFYQFNTKTKAYKEFKHIDKDLESIAGNCSKILTDSLNRLWCITEKGISLFNPKSGTFTNYHLNMPFASTGERTNIEVITADKEGNLWLGGSFKGLFYLDLKTAVATMYTHSNDAGSLPDFGSGIIKLFFDRSGTLWISMPWSGIAYLDQQKSMFNPLIIAPPSWESDESKDQNEFRIIGNSGDSLFYVNNTTGLFAWNYKHNSFKRIDLHNNNVYRQIEYVISANDGLVWIGCRGAGLLRYNPTTKSVKNFRNDPKDSTSISSDYINILIEDRNGDLWIGTGNKGLCRFNRSSETFTRYPFIQNNGSMKATNVLDDATVHSMFFDKEGILWIGTNMGGLNRLDTRTGKFTSFLDIKSGFNCVINIFEDSHNRLWAGTYLSGLFLIDRKTGNKKRYAEKDGLLFNAVIGISEDYAGNLWIASARGFSRFNPESGNFTNYPVPIGNSPSNDILYKGTDGSFQVAETGGLISFNPGKMNESKVPPAVVIESVSYSNEFDKDTVLFTYDRRQVDLKYNENRISFQFVALHYANPELNQYAYRLVGNDKDWIMAGTQRSATYTNLSPGTYTFQVKAANSDGVWNESGASFTVLILPPWWQTWWAYIIYGIIIMAGIFAVHRFQKERTIRIEREKNQKRELDQAKEIEKAYHQLKTTQTQLIQSEKMASLGELTAGIAHEIQNPLNFVNNFSEVSSELIDEMKEEMATGNWDQATEIAGDIKQNLEKISHHGKRADSIVKGMLQHSRSSTGQKEPTNINDLADEYLRLSYHGLRAKDKSFNANFKTDFDETLPEVNVVPQEIGRVLLNLINNAFYAVDQRAKTLTGFETLSGLDDYQPTVVVSTKKLDSRIQISIRDNGNGIPANVLEKIFQPFFTTKPTGQGTGLGLSLSYDIVTKGHGGELSVETTEGEKTEFKVKIPIYSNPKP